MGFGAITGILLNAKCFKEFRFVESPKNYSQIKWVIRGAISFTFTWAVYKLTKYSHRYHDENVYITMIFMRAVPYFLASFVPLFLFDQIYL